ncbi:MAG: transporter substrate-binding domain-containing protein [Exiguobacterium sp.]|uniref:Transporter substrate-binding domain-containing protein n=1 Tax=Exiguobacterium alkaliphilum TaxID=1428684 RepID=A0ABT2KZV0_9BACL|nr:MULTISPECIES: transporter substrate-binding domain-containing protein [Exiguobacterium]MDX5323073.1 transporter substrate-binding domain-containing protein [Exiguobacterium sp.]KDN59630.1 ABC transporter substrate-binding protein [Exiguobacterium sp. AB2]MCT4796443.1 transporter substrate-binding domain-containing protein [Exiguobacterium alkaliphilum]MDX5424849.1 transporter substrate-binding domain-containing protein [Exiguobacterium sp.]MDX6772305.1 transporter substrate-binding domain-c
MKKSLTAVLAFGASFGVLAACGSETNSGSEETVITVGTEATYPPFTYKDKGELTGYDIDVLNEAAERAGYTLEFEAMDFKGLVPALDAERIDLIANQMSITPERQEKYSFSDPYAISGAQVIVGSDNEDIQGIDDLEGKVVGSTQGSVYAQMAEEAGAEVKFYKGANQVLQDLQVGRLDAALNDRLFILTELEKTGYDVKAVGDVFNQSQAGFMARQDSDVLEGLNEALAEMKEDGTMEEIGEKYFGEDISQ